MYLLFKIEGDVLFAIKQLTTKLNIVCSVFHDKIFLYLYNDDQIYENNVIRRKCVQPFHSSLNLTVIGLFNVDLIAFSSNKKLLYTHELDTFFW